MAARSGTFARVTSACSGAQRELTPPASALWDPPHATEQQLGDTSPPPGEPQKRAARRRPTEASRRLPARKAPLPMGVLSEAPPVPAGGQEITPRADRHDLSAHEVSNGIGNRAMVEGGLSGPARTR